MPEAYKVGREGGREELITDSKTDLAKPEREMSWVLCLLKRKSFIDNELLIDERNEVRVGLVGP